MNSYKSKKNTISIRTSKIVCIFLSILVLFLYTWPANASLLDDKVKELQEINKKVDEYDQKRSEKADEANTLSSQIAEMDSQLEATRNEVERAKIQIEKTELEIEDVSNKITEKEEEIDYQNETLGECVRVMYEQDKTSALEIIVSSDSFASFLDQVKYVESIEDKTQNLLDEIEKLKNELISQKDQMEGKKKELTLLKEERELQEKKLANQIYSKNVLLEQTKSDEENYQNMLEEAKTEQAAMNSEIASIQSELYKKYRDGGGRDRSASGYIWPLYGVLTAPFGYSEFYFPGVFHTGIDIAAPTGTPIVSATGGEVFKAGWGGGYGNCVMVVNGNHLVVYGHMSALAVSSGTQVSQGQVIGYVGSTGFSTGPHLHFEIRDNFSVPVDPMGYLP